MVELLTIALASVVYWVSSSDDTTCALILSVLPFLIPAVEGVKAYLWKRSIRAAAIHLITSMPNVYSLCVSAFFGLSTVALVFIPQEYNQMGVRRPELYTKMMSHLNEGALCVVLSVAIVSLTYQLGRRLFVSESGYSSALHQASVIERFDFNKAFFIILGIHGSSVIVRGISYLSGQISRISQVDSVFGPFSSLANILIAYSGFVPVICLLMFHESKQKRFLWLMAVSLAFDGIYGVIFSTKASLMFPVAFALYGFIVIYRRLPSLVVLLSGAVSMYFIVLATVISRSLSRFLLNGSLGNLSGFEFARTVLYYSFIQIVNPEQGIDTYVDAESDYFLSRFNIMFPLLAAIEYVKVNGPVFDFGPYLNTVLSVVPSFLLMGFKPEPFDSNLFGRDIGLANTEDFFTTIRPSTIGNFYYSFGFDGVLVMSFIIGLLLVGAYWLIKSHYVKHELLAFLLVVLPLLDVENAFSNSYGSMIKNLVLAWAIGHYCTVRYLRPPTPSSDSAMSSQPDTLPVNPYR